MDGYRPTTYGDGFADVYDDWYAEVSPAEDTASFVADRVGGLVIELGSGTGRLAGPMRNAGVEAIGLDVSRSMLDRSRRRHPGLPVVEADMTEPPFRDGVASAVLIAFNTLFNLPTSSLQQRALGRAARVLAPRGIVIVEAFVPGDIGGESINRIDVVRQDADVVVLRISQSDPDAGTITGHHVELRDGAPVRLRPWHVCFTGPEGLDSLP